MIDHDVIHGEGRIHDRLASYFQKSSTVAEISHRHMAHLSPPQPLPLKCTGLAV